ncbi:MAG: hypothetical protein GX493_09515 [Firmicutes bacterium]|nr:hypothetical protein [Bacillota bacterium]
MVPTALLEIRECPEEGYRPLIDYGAWRVAALGPCEELLPERITSMQKHDETDEVFVLLRGRCLLFLGEGVNSIETIYAQEMEPLKVYNVKRGVWHTHVLSTEAMVLIVENRDTSAANSPIQPLTAAQQAEIVEAVARLWGEANAGSLLSEG